MLFSVKLLESLAERFLEDVLMREAKPSWTRTITCRMRSSTSFCLCLVHLSRRRNWSAKKIIRDAFEDGSYAKIGLRMLEYDAKHRVQAEPVSYRPLVFPGGCGLDHARKTGKPHEVTIWFVLLAARGADQWVRLPIIEAQKALD